MVCNNGNGAQKNSYKTHDNNNNSLKAFTIVTHTHTYIGLFCVERQQS